MPSNKDGGWSLKSVASIEQAFERRYQRVWVDELLVPGSTGWPYNVRVGRPSMRELEGGFAAIDAQLQRMRAWAEGRGLTCTYEMRRVGRHTYRLLSHVGASDVRMLAAAVRRSEHFLGYEQRLEYLRSGFPSVSDAGVRRVLVGMNACDMSDVDFDLTCRAAQWFSYHTTSGMTAREVPLEGFHAKWLDAAGHRSMTCILAGIDGLEFRERPHAVRFRYLDPGYLAGGARVHDCWVEGDCGEPAYAPKAVIICENRDSALWFKPVADGVAVQGDGMAGAGIIGTIPWVARASCVLYWGDIDRQGFEILSKYREGGLDVQSLLMDHATYERYQRFGTNVDKYGRQIAPKPEARALAGLTEDENNLYLQLCSPDFAGPRRLEQERIPLDVAQRLVLDCLSAVR